MTPQLLFYCKKRWHHSSCSTVKRFDTTALVLKRDDTTALVPKRDDTTAVISSEPRAAAIFHVSTAIIRGQIFLFQKRCLNCCCSKRDFTSAVILRWMDVSMASCYGPVLEHSTAVLQWTKWTREYNRNHLLAVTLLPLYSFNHSNYNTPKTPHCWYVV